MAASDKSESKTVKKTASAKTDSKKAASPGKSAARKNGADKVATAKKSPAEPKKAAATGMRKINAEERYRMTEVAAYFMAERNNFAGNPVEYWQAAEAQISGMLNQK